MAWQPGSLRAQLLREGYLVVPDVVPRAECEAAIAAMCAYVGVDIEDPASWPHCQAQGHGIVPLHHAQALWNIRQLPQVHAVFADVCGTERLWVTLDRVSFKLPAALRNEPFRMDRVHWDGDPRQPPKHGLGDIAVQGLVYLSDTPAEQGALALVPSLYKGLDAWLATPRSDAEVARPDITDYPLVAVPGGQGALVLWHRRMAHTSMPNNGTKPRLVQYVAMDPAPPLISADGTDNCEAYSRMAELCLEKRPPVWAVRQRVPGQLDPEPGPPVQFTQLGRRLAGIDVWP